ncbi:MAG: biotin--[acetyl-CoA-carboxylase] ligase [Nocardiopsaceae bacterium]|nr:biotin--[acetyl-CoA-carboxylase] ligase [Nocardiopsaceae bacterium]
MAGAPPGPPGPQGPLDPLDAGALHEELRGGLWNSVTVVPSTGSTNADLAAAGGPEGQVLVAEEQTAGRGRMGRSWVSQPGASLTFSALLRPDRVPAERRGWLPLLAGVAVAGAIREVSGLPAMLKWPNDVLIAGRKAAGILAEQAADGAVVIGIGINVATTADALPAGPGSAGPGSVGSGGLPGTSIVVEGGKAPRQRLLAEVLRGLERHYLAFRDNPDPEATELLAKYRTLCATLEQQVRAELPGARALTGKATSVDAAGRLLITTPGAVAPVPLSAGDVVHLR